MTKDNFSTKAVEYAIFRPTYPDELIEFLMNNTFEHVNALDCATGNGQVAVKLADHFKNVAAIDISERQLQNAIQKKNISYSLQQSEHTNFAGQQFDLITVGQAAHWFNLPEFYKEVNRTLKPGGILALFGYGLFRTEPAIDNVIDHFHYTTLEGYWDPERIFIDEAYQSFEFPYKKIDNNGFVSCFEWSIDQVIGYLSTWSAVQHFKTRTGADPVDLLLHPLREAWGNAKTKLITLHFFMITGRK